jgi:heme/copper-type cytochrome/quinol oxidase subunit 2
VPEEVQKPQHFGKIAIVVVLVLLIVGFASFLVLYDEGYLKQGQFAGTTVTFTIIEADPPNALAGLNGSYYKGTSATWPVLNVQQGDQVIIHVINNASSEPHGFAITHYFNSGTTVRPGQNYTLEFVANQAGTFKIYCNVFCSIHPFMQNGELIVSS